MPGPSIQGVFGGSRQCAYVHHGISGGRNKDVAGFDQKEKKKTGRRPVTEFLPAKDIEKCEESFFKTYLVMDGFVPWSEPSVAFHCPFLSERVLSREYISRITHSKVSLVIPVTTRARL